MVPHLITALTGSINELEQRILDGMPAIERWFRLEWMEHTPSFYCAVDIRNAGFKLAPVDTNLFPDGWHNLTPAMMPLAVQAAMAAIEKICPEAKNLLLIPKNAASPPHQLFYWMNLAQLQKLFQQAGLNVRLGSIDPTLKRAKTIELPGGESIHLEPVIRSKYRIGLKHFDPCTILLNNDLASGVPGILEDLHEQYLLPPIHAGWHARRRSTHLKSYEEVSKRFGKLIGIDPWLINPMYSICGEVDWSNTHSVENFSNQVDALLAKLKRKYKEFGITEKPFVVVKPDNGAAAGGCGMGIMVVRDSTDLQRLMGQAKQTAAADKTMQSPCNLVIQEGVHTYERMHDAVAEPVVYMMDRYVVGGFYRIHAERGAENQMNAPGAGFVPLAFAESAHSPQSGKKPGASTPNRFYMYGVIARLAMLAASYELEATDPLAEVYD